MFLPLKRINFQNVSDSVGEVCVATFLYFKNTAAGSRIGAGVPVLFQLTILVKFTKNPFFGRSLWVLEGIMQIMLVWLAQISLLKVMFMEYYDVSVWWWRDSRNVS